MLEKLSRETIFAFTEEASKTVCKLGSETVCKLGFVDPKITWSHKRKQNKEA